MCWNEALPQVPGTLIWRLDDQFICPSWASRLCDDIAGAQRFELATECGHSWQEERPLWDSAMW
jgi:hypothetical protein